MADVTLSIANTLPADAAKALLVGRVWRPDVQGPSVVIIRDDKVVDISAVFPTVRDACEQADPANALKKAQGDVIGSLADILANTPPDRRDAKKPWLLPPLDLQAVKAAGVTFALSMLERVIEERARGDADAAAAIRAEVERLVGNDLRALKPGSQQAMDLKRVLIAQGAWSQYLEVGIGPDAEIFTKATPLASVGTGMDAGLSSQIDLEQSRAGSRAGRIVQGPHRRGDARQRRQPARFRRPLGVAAVARRRTTTPPAPSGRSCASSTTTSPSTTFATRP